ncbi:MAG: glycosyltransferase family 4 protein [Thermoplasmata archaeon]
MLASSIFTPLGGRSGGPERMIRVCINSQTPPVRGLPGAPRRGQVRWELGRHYTPQIGGVVPMMRALLRSGLGHWMKPDPLWVALGSADLPKEVRTSEGYTVATVDLPANARAGYGRFKESLWRSFHGPATREHFDHDYRSFVEYSYRMADRLLESVEDYDVFYIQDYQQILVGGLVGSTAPTLLRWHIPVEFGGYSEVVRRFFLKSMEGFDAIVVSTRAGLEELIQAGFQGRAFQVYPYIDPNEQHFATDTARGRFREKIGLGDEPFLLSVARMDPVKRQDLLIDAYARLRRRFPNLKLVLVGGESFSTQTLSGRHSRSKAVIWEGTLRKHVRDRKVEDGVIFTGGLSSEDLQAAYSTALVFAHPAPWEGFGLVGVEAWSHNLPIVVSNGAGISELVIDDINGYTVPAGSSAKLAERIGDLLRHPEAAYRMGQMGPYVARRCYVKEASPRLKEIFDRTISLYGGRGRRDRRGL